MSSLLLMQLSTLPAILILLIFPMYAICQNTWTGNLNNRWDVAGNWSYEHVPSGEEDVLIPSDSVIIPQGFAGQISKMTLNNTAILSIEEGASLLIRRWHLTVYEYGTGCMNFGKLYCSGTLSIDSMEYNAITNDGDFIILGSGSSLLDNDGGGLINNGKFENLGSFEASNCINEGIYNSNMLTNEGSILIKNYQRKGLSNDGVLTNFNSIILENGVEGFFSHDSLYNAPGGTLEVKNISGPLSNGALWIGRIGINHGVISIVNGNAYGIRIISEFENYGNIEISTVAYGLRNEGKLINGLTGVINVDSTMSYVVLNVGILCNLSTVKLRTSQTYGIWNYGQLFNYDSILIENSINHGIRNSDSLMNCIGGVIHIYKTHAEGSYGIYNDSLFINQGRILVDSAHKGGIWNTNSNTIRKGIFVNEDTLIIQNSDQLYSRGIFNVDSFYNGENGRIIIRKFPNYSEGISNYTGDFTNDGLIVIDSITGNGLSNVGNFSNYNEITISRITSTGFRNGFSGTLGSKVFSFENLGKINIHNIAGVGLSNFYQFKNAETGNISLRNLKFYGLQNQWVSIANRNTNIFENLGLITIDSVASGIGLNNDGNMMNKDSMIIKNIDQTAVVNLDTLLNMLGASIICQSSGNGILNGQSTSPNTAYLINNSGDILIKESTGRGFLNGGKLDNTTEGKIIIEQPHEIPLESILGSVIHNNGILEIRK